MMISFMTKCCIFFNQLNLCRVDTMEVKREEEDRISLLPDCLIINEILSRLESTKQAIRTSILSKRWLHLWPSVPTLIFKNYVMKKYSPSDHKQLPDFYRSVDETLTHCRHSLLENLNKFELSTRYDDRFKSQVNNWIRFATNSNVQHLHLSLRYKKDEDQFVLEDDSFFINSHFTHLDLGYCAFDPMCHISWNNLTDLTISDAKLDENVIENILSGSPLLDTLTLVCCCGFSLLDITSKSVKNLVIYGYSPHEDQEDLDDIVEINAPYISSLTVVGNLLLWKLLLRDVSSLGKAYLDYAHMGHCEMTSSEEKEEMLTWFIPHLHHVKEVQIGNYCNTAPSRLKAKGFSFPLNLKPDKYSTGLGDCSDTDSYDDDDDDYDDDDW